MVRAVSKNRLLAVYVKRDDMKPNDRILKLSEDSHYHPEQEHTPFIGFSPLKSNVTYVPNQFFDVVLRHASRPTVRIVSYMLRKTLGWCDEFGNPQEEQISASYNDLGRDANVSRRSILKALHEATQFCYLNCVREGKPDTSNNRAVSALYELCWDEQNKYTAEFTKFSGFYARDDANRTYVPNEFFDVVVKTEPLSVIKVVGAIIRNTIGYSTKAGFRRQITQKSFTELMWSTHLTRKHLNNALKTALIKNYIYRVEEGVFDTNAGLESKASIYSISWAKKNEHDFSNQDQLADRGKKDTGPTREKRIPGNRCKRDTRTGAKKIPASWGKKDTGIEIKQINKTFIKQQHDVVVGDDFVESYGLLISAGVTENKAIELSRNYSFSEIKNQFDWINFRTVTRNRTGLLIKAIENQLPCPESGNSQISIATRSVSNYYAAWAGNTENPIAQPSDKEISIAEDFLARLKEICPGIDLQNFGRRFGEFARKSNGNYEQSNNSFVLAVRSQGDRFYSQLLNESCCRQKASISQTKKAHKEKNLQGYFYYLQQREGEIRGNNSDLYGAFIENCEKQKQRSLMMLTSDGNRKKYLETFNSTSAKRTRFLEHFKDHNQWPVFDFWTWDEKLNPDGYKPGDAM